jgi:hypothetical protein
MVLGYFGCRQRCRSLHHFPKQHTVVPSIDIVRANPLDHAAGIKELFRTHERPEFPEFFDRAYPSAVENGGSSWIGVGADGRPVLHVALFRQRFALGDRTLVGGLVVNLIAASSHRTFLPALALMRRLVADSRTESEIDFLYGDPNAPAWALLKIVGFAPIGTLRRFTLPLADQRWYADAAIRAYRAVVRLRAPPPRVVAVAHPADRYHADALERPAGSVSAMRPFRPVALYRQRLPGYPSMSDCWFTLHQRGPATSSSAAALVRASDDGVARLISVSRDPSLSMSAIIPPIARALRRAGSTRLWISTLEETRFAAELKRAGFAQRVDNSLVVALALTEPGASALRAVSTWEITDLDCDR